MGLVLESGVTLHTPALQAATRVAVKTLVDAVPAAAHAAERLLADDDAKLGQEQQLNAVGEVLHTISRFRHVHNFDGGGAAEPHGDVVHGEHVLLAIVEHLLPQVDACQRAGDKVGGGVRAVELEGTPRERAGTVDDGGEKMKARGENLSEKTVSFKHHIFTLVDHNETMTKNVDGSSHGRHEDQVKHRYLRAERLADTGHAMIYQTAIIGLCSGGPLAARKDASIDVKSRGA